MPLYNLVLFCAAAIGLPQAVPMFLGLFVRRAPNWSLWSTLLIGFGTSILLSVLLTRGALDRAWFHGRPLSNGEFNDLNVAVTTGVLLAVCVGWFYFTALIGRRTQSAAERERIDAFFAEMNTPIDMDTEHGDDSASDTLQYRVLGMLSLTFGGFIAALAVLPNSPGGRLGLLFCGGAVAGVGGILLALARRRMSRHFSGMGVPPMLFEQNHMGETPIPLT
jgi:hypothetical protein